MKVQGKTAKFVLPLALILLMPMLPQMARADEAATVKPPGELQLNAEQPTEDRAVPPIEQPKKLLNGQVSRESSGAGVPDSNPDGAPPVPAPNVGAESSMGKMGLQDALNMFNSLRQMPGGDPPRGKAGLQDAFKMLDSLRQVPGYEDSANVDDAVRSLRKYSLKINGRTVISPGAVVVMRSQQPKLSADEYRKMEYGVIGMVATVPVNGSGPVVTAVHPTCPAEFAGILPGDVIVKADNYVFKRGDGQRVFWKTIGGKAGTPVDVTVLRNAELITFHLVRMNIEDIADDHIRTTFETLLDVLGPPNADGQMSNIPDETTVPPGM